MLRKRWMPLALALALLAGVLPETASALEAVSGEVCCFAAEDLSTEEGLTGICVTELDEELSGRLYLEQRTVVPGDILTAEQVCQMTFLPLHGEDRSARLCYLPVYEDRVGPEAVLTFSIRGRGDKAPAAEDSALETYKNLSVTGQLKASDPEGQTMVYTVTRQPKRGSVEIGPDGSFTYTPKKNKVGIDSFQYTATDPAGNVSREATVTVTILKTTAQPQYADTVGRDCRFAAEWMKNTGIFVGEQLDGNACFQPDRPVTRGEFITMTVKALELMEEETGTFTGYTDDIPLWLRPYVAAAVRAGLTAGLPDQERFGAEEIITGAEAAVILQNALDLAAEAEAVCEDVPVWAEDAVTALSGSGMEIHPMDALTREEAALMLYRADCLRRE